MCIILPINDFQNYVHQTEIALDLKCNCGTVAYRYTSVKAVVAVTGLYLLIIDYLPRRVCAIASANMRTLCTFPSST